MYIGNYLNEIKNNEIDIHYDLEGMLCDVLCIKEANENVYVLICTPEAENIEEYEENLEILSKTTQNIGKSIKLPDEFLEFIKNDSAAVVFGCRDKIEIHNKDICIAEPLDDKETLKIIQKALQKLDELGI